MTKCKKCGEKLKADSIFCPNCGVQVKKLANEKSAVKTVRKTTVQKKVVDKDAVAKARAGGIKAAFRFFASCGIDFDEELGDEIPIIRATELGNSEMIQALLSVGASVDITDSNGNTALMKASEDGKNQVAKLLIDHGADVDLKNNYDETALSLARDKGNKYIVGLLRKAEATDSDDD
ncbi:MAG: ankyrin repeat domain-containing protein [Treponema sp.]|nr:ankyrin repeat domain-containing protein [Treponema sp.]